MRTLALFLLITTLAISLVPSESQAQWVFTKGPDYSRSSSVNSLAMSGPILFAGTDSRGVFRSTDDGANWSQVDSGLTNMYVTSLAVSGSNLLVGTMSGVFLSTNNGGSWTQTGLTNTPIYSLAASGTNLFAGSGEGWGVFLSTNNGTSWTQVGSALTISIIYSLAASGTNLFAGGAICGIEPCYGVLFLSTNNGASWTPASNGLSTGGVNPFVPMITSLAACGTNLFAGVWGGGGVFLSTNNGTSWSAVPTGLTYSYVHALAVSGESLFAGIEQGGVMRSTNNGTSWNQVNAGLADTIVNCLVVSGTNLFAGTKTGVWRRPLSELTTSAQSPSSQLPVEFELDQNYPNPFNPTTTIRYALPQRSHVTLTVFNTLGQQVALLVNGDQDARSHEVKFDASTLASGVYFYRLLAGSFVQIRTMLLLR